MASCSHNISKKAGPSSFSYAGEDVVMDILSRLPVKSLARFKCVCKSWSSIIKSPYFISKRLQHNLINDSNAMLFVVSNERPRSVSWFSSLNNEVVYKEVPSLLFSDDGENFDEILGPVNGIYCAISNGRFHATIKGHEDSLLLINPALREFKAISPVPTLNDNITYGFGYDSRSNDFKVVVVTWRYFNASKIFCVFIYTLSSNSWRKIDSSDLPAFSDAQPAVYVRHGNGVIHWLAEHDNSRSAAILSFDLGTEVFKKSALPESDFPGVPCGTNTYLTVFKDSIVVILGSRVSDHFKGVSSPNYEIWLMKNYGVKESWSKLYNIEPLPNVIRPIGLWKDGEILFVKIVWARKHYQQLVSYDPSSQQIKDLPILYPYHVVTHMGSLVSINGSRF